jgi:hypothetical protein
MRWMLSVVLAVAVVTPSLAADLTVTTRKKVHHRVAMRVVRDYDGTPIALRPRPDGTLDAVWVQRATPSRYLNGERVLP